jgi:hypothetical protein
MRHKPQATFGTMNTDVLEAIHSACVVLLLRAISGLANVLLAKLAPSTKLIDMRELERWCPTACPTYAGRVPLPNSSAVRRPSMSCTRQARGPGVIWRKPSGRYAPSALPPFVHGDSVRPMEQRRCSCLKPTAGDDRSCSYVIRPHTAGLVQFAANA